MPIGDIQEYEGQVYSCEPETRGCDGCAVKEDAENGITPYCEKISPRCVGIIWVRSAGNSYGPYREAWTFARRAAAEAARNEPSTISLGATAGDEHTGLKKIVQRHRPYYKNSREEHPVIEYMLENYGPSVNWHALVLENPSRSIDRTRINYFRDPSRAEKWYDERRDGLLTVVTIGKYLKRHWPKVPDHELRDVVERFGPAVIKMVETVKEFIHAAQTGPESCMQLSESVDEATGKPTYSTCFGYTPYHPYHVYDPALGWKMAVAFKDGKIMGRALCYDNGGDIKCFVRSYGSDTSEGYTQSHPGLDKFLKDAGYKYLDEWPEGTKFKVITPNLEKPVSCNSDLQNHLLMPYIDPGYNRASDVKRRVSFDGEYMVRDDEGPFTCNNTNGATEYDEDRADDTPQSECQDCGEMFDDDELITVGRDQDRCVCESCRGANYTIARSEGRNYRYIPDGDVVSVDGDAYDERYLDDNSIVTLHDGEYAHQRYCTWVESENEWYRDTEITHYDREADGDTLLVYLGDDEHAELDDCQWCAYNHRYYLESTMTEVREDVWVHDDNVADWDDDNADNDNDDAEVSVDIAQECRAAAEAVALFGDAIKGIVPLSAVQHLLTDPTPAPEETVAVSDLETQRHIDGSISTAPSVAMRTTIPVQYTLRRMPSEELNIMLYGI